MNNQSDPNIDEREWQAQERALQHARQGTRPGLDDPLAGRYRDVVGALRQPLDDSLPTDFASRIAALAQRQADHAAALDLRLERNLMRALVLVLALSGAIAVALYGPAAWQSLAAMVPQSQGASIGWVLPLAGCIALSWSLDAVRKTMAAHGRGPTHS